MAGKLKESLAEFGKVRTKVSLLLNSKKTTTQNLICVSILSLV